jgi:hypothetical protein
MTAMAKIRFVSGEDRLVPDDYMVTDRGIEWADEGEDGEDGARHIVPWSAVVEFTGPPTGPPMVVSPS